MIMNPNTRKIRKVSVKDAGAADIVLNNLMGSDSAPKKEFVFGHEITEIV